MIYVRSICVSQGQVLLLFNVLVIDIIYIYIYIYYTYFAIYVTADICVAI